MPKRGDQEFISDIKESVPTLSEQINSILNELKKSDEA